MYKLMLGRTWEFTHVYDSRSFSVCDITWWFHYVTAGVVCVMDIVECPIINKFEFDCFVHRVVSVL
jgi:hypothetical protein